MMWRSGKPVEDGYYLCAVRGCSSPTELYWNGSSWSYAVEYESNEIVENDYIRYYMNLNDIPMPEGW